MRLASLAVVLALIAFDPAFAAGAAKTPDNAPTAIALPGGSGGVGFDDLGYSSALQKVLLPGGRTGKLFLVNPATSAVTSISGFGAANAYSGGHRDGITSVSEGAGLLFAVDRTQKVLCLIDPAKKSIVSRAPLSAGPDYVRWIDPPHEVWVTEPESARIEIYRLEDTKPPRAVPSGFIAVYGGPEALTLDLKHRRAYTNIGAETAAIDFRSRSMVGVWKNGCDRGSGIAVDTQRGFLFVGCFLGNVNVLDLASGAIVDSTRLGAGVDILSYSPELGHLYVPSSRTKTLTILGVSTGGTLTALGTFPGSADSHSVAAAGRVFLTDQVNGRLLAITDPYPSSVH